MDESNPETWLSPGWHEDWDGDWQFEQLRILATQFLGSSSSRLHKVVLEIIDDGYVRVAFHDADRCLGVAYVNRARTHPDPTPVFAVYFGADDDELNTESKSKAIQCLSQAQGHWEHEPDT